MILPDSHQAQLVQEMLAATPPLPPSSPLPPPEESSTPAAQLVTELFQSLKAKSSPEQHHQQEEDGGEKVSPHGLKAKSSPLEQPDPNPFQQSSSTPVFKPPLKKVVPGPVANPSTAPSPPPVNFKSQLKKTNNSALYAQPGTQEEPGVVDFKSALRKVEKPGRPGASEVQANAAGSPDLGFRAGLRSVAGGDLHKRAVAESVLPSNNEEEEVEESILEEENKRKSTGSISSLVKMWEPSSPRDAAGASAVSPSLASDSDRPGSVVKFEKRVWPPVPSTETEKPMVPVKPTVKPPPTSKPPPPREPSYKPPPKPLASAKPQVCNIYAAPSSVSARGSSTSPRTSTSGPSRPNISAPAAKPKSPSSAAAESVSNGGPAETAKEEVTSKEEEQVGTREAATKAAKELEIRLA